MARLTSPCYIKTDCANCLHDWSVRSLIELEIIELCCSLGRTRQPVDQDYG